MDEVKKESKGIKKLVYEEPRLVKLSDNTGVGDCTNGSSALGTDSTCNTGNVADSWCNTGNTPGNCVGGSGD